jgi:nitrate reductase NapAB chaperone NapD
MPVFSYLAFPNAGQMDELCDALTALDYCEVIPSDNNREVAILVTDTPDDATEKELQAQLKKIKSLQSLNMTFGHMDQEKSGR